ncbi:cytochrome d ubiquinol oxidase subunit II [Chengkuizengella marina]|uniref:Cytochrome bd-I ubiquinol oxidase subunit 2 apoprotein n=1 Tax=Chengkuizengella marina TaxID=2507566 RepID=A0A6N9Q0Y4_9BACL|nr:cytochrome d ubiquinol oxidase subunit II [Chengkuizengella marina]NBI28987.1 hypothetical protein [Chengkuizengella marina]
MSDEILAITLLWMFVFIYSVAASIDFGAGFWSMIYLKKPHLKATDIANRYLSPSWEVTNVFIVLIVVGLVTFFPTAAFKIGSALLIPGSLIILLLAIRSAFLVFSHTAYNKYKSLLYIISGISGILIPALLISILPITQGGFIDGSNGTEQLLFSELITSGSVYTFIGFGITSTLFLSSLLLADYSNVAEETKTYQIYRTKAIVIGPISLIMAFLILLTMREEANWLFENMMSEKIWLLLSVITFIIGYIFLWIPGKKVKGQPRGAVLFVILQYFIAGYAYGKAHLPYIIYPDMTLRIGFTDPNTFRALFVVYIVGFIVLTPGFYVFWKMFLKDKRYLKHT